MTRVQLPITHCIMQCDGDDGLCLSEETDYHEIGASAVNGVRVNGTVRAPGWVSAGDEDYCPEHANEAGSEERDG